MEKSELKNILKQVAERSIDIDEAILKFKNQPFEDLGFAKIDTHRAIRQGIGEVIYAAGKTGKQIAEISEALMDKGQKTILITRLSKEKADIVKDFIDIKYWQVGNIGIVGELPKEDTKGTILVVTGGTSDIPITEEAALTAQALGNRVARLYDVGVAGIHRLLAHSQEIMKAKVIIAVAGMEGALASVIGGISDCPVIAVPTSVGYGASFGGVAALLSMLNSCASGVTVVNIDNGFGAGYTASMINHIGE